MQQVINKPCVLVAALGVALLTSCRGSQIAEEPDSERPSASAPADIDLHVMSLADVRERVAALKGRYVVVDLWALW